jgi:hypothetical protein
MIAFRYISSAVAALTLCSLATAPAAAQLLSETLQGTERVCTYVGNDTLPDGQVVPRTFSVGAGQNCPATAPYRDPNAPVPANAMLTGERTTATDRICVYEEGGLQYQLSVDLSLRCAMTPALLERARTASADAALG